MYKIIHLKLNCRYEYYISVNTECYDELLKAIRNCKDYQDFDNLMSTLYQYDADCLEGETIEICGV